MLEGVVFLTIFFNVVEGLGTSLGHNWKGETKSLAQTLLGVSEWHGNETRSKLCWEYLSGMGMRLGPSYVGK